MSLQKNIKILTWFNFFTDLKLYAPIAIIYFSKVSHSYALGASIFSITMITSAIFDIPSGVYSDKIGRRKTVIIGAFFATLAVIGYAIGINYWFLVLGAIAEGISRAFYSGNNDALLHNMLSEEGLEHEFHTYSGKLNGMFQVALAISALTGGILANFSFSLLMWLSVIPQSLCFVLGLQLDEVRAIDKKAVSFFFHMKEALKSFVNNKNLRLLSAGSILGYAIGESGYQFQAAFFQTFWPIWAVGIAKMMSNVFAAISFFTAGKLIRKIGALKTLLLSNIYGTTINIFSLAFPSMFSPALMVTPSLFYGSEVTAEKTLLQKEFTDEQRATMSSLNSFLGSFVFAIFIFITGVFADKLTPGHSLLIFQSMYIVVIILQLKLFGQVRKNPTIVS